jgi:hypothetical protein
LCCDYRRANDNNTVLFATPAGPAGSADNDDNNGASDAGGKANQV